MQIGVGDLFLEFRCRAWSEEPQRTWCLCQVSAGWFMYRSWGRVTGKPSCSQTDVVDFISGDIQAEAFTWQTYHIIASNIQTDKGIEVCPPALSVHNSGSCKGYYSKLGVFLPTDHYSVFQQTSPSICPQPLDTQSQSLDTQSQSLP